MHPGEGAIEYAREITEGLTREEAARIIAGLRNNEPNEPRIKLCATCGFPFRDKTRPGNSKVCGSYCKTGRKSIQKAKQRAKKAENQPPKYKKPIKYDEQSFLLRLWRKEKPFDPEKIERIRAARQRVKLMGGRRTPKREVEY